MIEPIVLQRCSKCKESLPKEAYSQSQWGRPGFMCRWCGRQRKMEHDFGITVTKADIESMFLRQRGKCLACLKPISLNAGKCNKMAAVVDHSHNTGIVRGLLCRMCNLALGALDENAGTLRRLMVYLDYDRSKLQVYLAGSLRNPRVPIIAMDLRAAGYDVMDDWYAAGATADDSWQAYETARGHSYEEALRGRAAQNTFLFDKAHLDLSDLLIAVLPCGKSAHLEMGYFVGQGKPVFILQEGVQGRFEIMPNFVTKVFNSLEELQLEVDLTFQLKKG